MQEGEPTIENIAQTLQVLFGCDSLEPLDSGKAREIRRDDRAGLLADERQDEPSHIHIPRPSAAWPESG